MKALNMNKSFQAACLVSVLALTACASNNPQDPYEPYNRAMYRFNDKVDTAVVTPVTRGYQKAIPKPIRAAITNVFNNFRDVISFGSNVLRLDLEKSSTDLMRVAFNTTFGLGGLIDMSSAVGMPNNKNTLGDTFASWGWKNSNYLVLPLFGPSTVRDTWGTLPTMYYSPESALIQNSGALAGVSALKAIDTRSQYLGITDVLQENPPPDPYAYTRDLFMGMRSRQTGGQYQVNVDDDDWNIEDLDDEDTSAGTSTSASVETSSATPETLVQAALNHQTSENTYKTIIYKSSSQEKIEVQGQADIRDAKAWLIYWYSDKDNPQLN